MIGYGSEMVMEETGRRPFEHWLESSLKSDRRQEDECLLEQRERLSRAWIEKNAPCAAQAFEALRERIFEVAGEWQLCGIKPIRLSPPVQKKASTRGLGDGDTKKGLKLRSQALSAISEIRGMAEDGSLLSEEVLDENREKIDGVILRHSAGVSAERDRDQYLSWVCELGAGLTLSGRYRQRFARWMEYVHKVDRMEDEECLFEHCETVCRSWIEKNAPEEAAPAFEAFTRAVYNAAQIWKLCGIEPQ